jgi:phage-related protein
MLFISAEHISYDLNGYAVQMEQSGDIFEYVNYIKTKCVNERFDFNLSVEGPDGGYTFFEHIKPATARALLFNLTNLPNNPDLKFDRFDVKILTEGRGKDKGFSIRYGVNLLEYSQSDLFQNVYTHIMPYWLEDIGTGQEFIVTHYLPEKIISTGANYNFSRILPVDFTSALSSYDEVTDGVFRFVIDSFLSENNLGIPDPEIVVDVASLENLTNEKVSDVELGDVVKVVLPQYALEIPRRCVKTIFDCLRDRYVQLEIGRTRTGIERDIYMLYKQQEENKFDIAYDRIYNRNNYQRKY